MGEYGKISYANSRKMLERAEEVRQKIMAAAEQCSQYPRDLLADWLHNDVTDGLRDETNRLLYEFAGKNGMSLHDVCMHYMPVYDFKTNMFDKDGRCTPSLDVDISLEPMPLDLEHGPGYWKDKYFKLKERMQKSINDDDDAEDRDETVTLARGHHVRNADGTVTDVSDDPNYECKRTDGDERD